METEALRADPKPGRDAPGPVGWTLTEAAWVLLIFLATPVLISLVLGGRPRSPLQAALLLPGPHLVLGVATLLWVRARSKDGIRRLVGLERPSVRAAIAGLVYGVLGTLVLTFAIGFLLQALVHAFGSQVPPVQRSLRELTTGPAAPLASLVIVAIAPLAEELFFRGMLFQAFERWFGTWLSAVASAGVFAIQHAEPDLLASVIVVVPVFLFGVYLALIFRRCGTIITPIIAHMLFNGFGVLFIRAGVG
ncbi:MAG: lysostaphin resistance A-like protein [Egibacteraceae bacterium]